MVVVVVVWQDMEASVKMAMRLAKAVEFEHPLARLGK